MKSPLRASLLCLTLLGLSAMTLSDLAAAKPWWMRGDPSNEDDYLPPDVAFRVAASVDGKLLRVRWIIADGYYLYRRKIEIKAESPDLIVAAAALPGGIMKTDPYLGTQEIYEQQVEATVPFSRFDGGAHPLQIKVTYQGCATAGLCYPPITKVLFPQLPAPVARSPSYPWEGAAIIAGNFAFLAAGLLLRKGRTFDPPPA
jgi:thiol:disulfide interchange protein DsbD